MSAVLTQGLSVCVQRTAACLVAVIMLVWAPCAESADDRFDPLGYRDQGNQVPIQDTAQQACDVYASWWRWNRSPYSVQLLQELPGR